MTNKIQNRNECDKVVGVIVTLCIQLQTILHPTQYTRFDLCLGEVKKVFVANVYSN